MMLTKTCQKQPMTALIREKRASIMTKNHTNIHTKAPIIMAVLSITIKNAVVIKKGAIAKKTAIVRANRANAMIKNVIVHANHADKEKK